MHVDGAARGNPGPAGIGGVVTDETGGELLSISEYIGETTNNIAEYTALVFILQSLSKFRASELKIFSDSELLVNQMNGTYKVKNQNLKVYFGWAKALLRPYDKVEVVHVTREQNTEADQLANAAIDRFLGGEKEPVNLEGLPEQKQLF